MNPTEKSIANLKPAKKGEVRNPYGRPKKFTTVLREHGYKLNEINDTIQVMMAMTIDELKSVYTNPNATVLEKTIANAMRTSLQRGSLYSIETLLTRAFGKPKEISEITTDSKIEVVFVKGKSVL